MNPPSKDLPAAVERYTLGRGSVLDLLNLLGPYAESYKGRRERGCDACDDDECGWDGCEHGFEHGCSPCCVFMTCVASVEPVPLTLFKWGLDNVRHIGYHGTLCVINALADDDCRRLPARIDALLCEHNFAEALWQHVAIRIASGMRLSGFVYDVYKAVQTADGLPPADVISGLACFRYLMRTEADLRGGLVTEDDLPPRVLDVMQECGWSPEYLRRCWASARNG